MSPRQARRERREAARKAKKLELKKSRLAQNHPLAAAIEIPEFEPQADSELGLPVPLPDPTFNSPLGNAERPVLTDQIGFVSQNTPSRAEINRANAQHSTGPRTDAGKSTSSRNSTKHGLASGQVLIPGEDPAAFESLLNDLFTEHQPATRTEHLLIEEMAQSHWLAQRAIRLQNDCFTADGVNEKQLALFLRYQTTHQRRFHQALNTLRQIKKEARRPVAGFVSHVPPKSLSAPGFVSQNGPATPPPPQFVRQNTPDSDANPTSERKKQAA